MASALAMQCPTNCAKTTNFLQLLKLQLPLRRSYFHFKLLLLKSALGMTPYSYFSFFLQVNPDIKWASRFCKSTLQVRKTRRAYVPRLHYLLFFVEQKKWIEKIMLTLHSDQGLWTILKYQWTMKMSRWIVEWHIVAVIQGLRRV